MPRIALALRESFFAPVERSVIDDVLKRYPALNIRRTVRCEQCGRADECSASDLLRFTREGWPRCCGQVMALFTEVEKRDSDDTARDPPLPP